MAGRFAETLTADLYRDYGDVVSARADVVPVKANAGTADRFNWLGALENKRPGSLPNLCVFRSAPFQGDVFVVKGLERHAHSTQLFVPMTCLKRYLVVVARGGDEPDLSTVKAFIAARDQGVTYRPGVWHHPLIALDAVTDFACVVWEDRGPGDCDVRALASPLEFRLT